MASVMPASPPPTMDGATSPTTAAAASPPDAAAAASSSTLAPARLASPSLSWAEQAKVRHSANSTTNAPPPVLSRAASHTNTNPSASTHESPPPARTNNTIKARGSTGLTSSTTSPLLLSHTPQRVHVDPLAPPSPLQLRTPLARPVATPLSHMSSNSSFQGHGHGQGGGDSSNMSSPSHSRSHSLQQQQQQLLLSQQRAEAHLSLPLTASSVPKSYPIQLLGGPSYATSGGESPSSSLSQLGHHPSPASSSYGAQSFRHGPLSIHESVRCSSTTSSCAGGGGGGGGGSLSARRGSTASMTEAFLSSLGRHAGAPLALQQHQQLEHGSGLAAVPHQPEQVHAELKALMHEQVQLMAEVQEELAELEAKSPPSASLSPVAGGSPMHGAKHPSSSLSPDSCVSPVHSSVHALLLRQQSLIARSLQSLSQSLSSFLLMRDIYLSAAYAERRVRAQLALDLTLSLHRKKGLEASTDAIIACLVSSLGAENCAIYYVGSTHLFGLEPSDPRSFDPYRARRFRKNEFVAGFVAAESKPVLLARRANEHAFFDPVPDSLTGIITRSLMCVPIRDEHDGTVLAVIQMINKMRTKSPPPPPPPHAPPQPASAGSASGSELPSLPASGHSSAAVTTSTSVASSSCVSTPSSTTEHPMSSLSVPAPVQPLNPRRATSGSIPSPVRSGPPTTHFARTTSTPMIGSNAAAAAAAAAAATAGYAPIPMLLPSPSSHVPVTGPASSSSPPSSHPRGSGSDVFTFPSAATASSDAVPAAASANSVPRHSPSISATPSLSTTSDLGLADPSSQQLFDDEADPTAGAASQSEEEPYPYGEFSTEDLDLLYSLSLSLAAPLRRFLPEILLDSFSLSGRAGVLGDGQMYGSVAGEQLVGALGSSNSNHSHLLQHAQMLPLLSQSPPLPDSAVATYSQDELSSRSEASSQGSTRSPELSPRKLGPGAAAASGDAKTSTSIYNATATPPSSSPSAPSASQPVLVPAGRGSGNNKSSRSSAPQRSDSPPAPVPASVPTPIPSRLAFAPSTFSSGNNSGAAAARAGGPVNSGSSALSGTTYALPSFGSGLGRNTAPQPITTAAISVAATPTAAPPAVAGQFDADQVRSLVHSYAAGETSKQSNRSNRGVTRARTLSYQWPANDKGAGSPFAAHLAANGGVLASTAAAAANSSTAVAAPAVSSAIPSSTSTASGSASRDSHSHHNSPAILGSSTPTQSYLPLPPSASASPFISATMGSLPTPHPHLHPNPFPRVFSIEDLHSLSFCVFDYSETELVRFIVGIFTSMGLIDEFKIPLNVLHGFLMGVRKGYRANPFHNFIHGFSVMHFAYYTLRHSTASEHLLPHDVLGLLVASLTHDLDHPGQTNAYEIASQSALALRYNDIHVLEMHHACSTFTLLRQEKCNIFREITAPEIRSSIRGSMVKAILSTDMAQHFTELKKLDEACTKMGQDARAQQAAAAAAAQAQQQYSGGSMPTPELVRNTSWPHSSSAPAAGAGDHDPSDPSNLPVGAAALRSMLPFDPESEKDRQSLINVIIHSADLSGQVFPTHIARQWEERISREFAAQAALETAAGLPVAPFMRGLDSLQTRAKLQVNFIEFVLLPWWRSAARLLSPALDPCLRILQQNKEYFERLAAIGQPIGPGGEDAIMLAAASAPQPQQQQQPQPQPVPAPIQPAAPLVTPPRVSAVSVTSPRLQSHISSPMVGTSKALRVLGITAIPQVVTGTPVAGATRDIGSPLSSPISGAAAPIPFSPTTASSPILMRPPSMASLPPTAPVAAAAPADPSTKSQLHAVQAVSPKTTPVQTASSVLKSVPLLTSHNPARSSGGLAHIQPSSSMAHSLDSPGSAGRKRSSTEVSRPARRSGGALLGSGVSTHSLGGGGAGGHGMLVEEGGELRFAPSGTRIDPHMRHAASGALLQELGLPRVHKDSIAEDEPPTLDGSAAAAAGNTSAPSTASATAPTTPARA